MLNRLQKLVSRAAFIGILIMFALLLGMHAPLFAQITATISEINPDQSTLDPTDPDAASGGRVNGLAAAPDGDTFYAASEWGGIFKSIDVGRTWFRLDGHLPVATWDVEVDPSDPDKVYATSFYDGRVNSLAGINVSSDGGITWVHPATATPPVSPYTSDDRRDEPSAFGISIDPDKPENVYIGTNAGLAISNDAGATWTYVDPTPDTPADDIWDVVVHDGGIIDLVGEDGHQRSIDGGVSWTTATGAALPSGRGSIAVSPYESYVLFAVVGTTIYESDDGGASWPNVITNPASQGRIPFVATNRRSNGAFDLWFGDVQLHRATCITPSPPAPGGTPRAPAASWIGPFTRSVGGHDDCGDIVFDPTVSENACPVLFSSDGGVYYNTRSDSSECHDPFWEQPTITPHGLWIFGMDGADRPGLTGEYLYFGSQDDGTFATIDAGAPSPTWFNRQCCDGFDASADSSRVLYTVCCAGSGRSNRLYMRNPGMIGGSEINTYPPGNLPGFRPIDVIDQFGPDDYVLVTSEGVFITSDITANPIVWTQLGAATTPAGAGGVKVGITGATPTFYVQSGNCNGRSQDRLWRYDGTAPGGAWQQVNPPGGTGGFGIYDVDLHNPNRLFASHLRSGADPQMILSTDGGVNWTSLPILDDLMVGSGVFKYQNNRGPTAFTGFGGYPQPTMVAFDPNDPSLMVAGGADSGVFVSNTSGFCWTLVTDPIDPVGSGKPHIPRPQFAYFDHKPSVGSQDNVDLYIGTRGRGVWRISLAMSHYRYEYAAKIVCGLQKDPEDMRLARGFYATTINIHNPNDKSVSICKKLALTYPTGEQAPGEILPIAIDRLKPDEALAVDCMDIKRTLFPSGFPKPYIEGFIVIKSQESLDVTAVYTTASLDEDDKVTSHSSIDVEHIREHKAKEPVEEAPPDLIPVPPFCEIEDEKLVVFVKNQGPGDAGSSSVTEVDFLGLVKVTMPTDPLLSGQVQKLLFDTPPSVDLGTNWKYRVTVDVNNNVTNETNEGNNTSEHSCFVIK